MHPERPERTLAVALLILALGGGLLARVLYGLTDLGSYWPDEIYQSLEPGHHLAFGYGLLPWEYVDGARSWLLPGVLSLLFRATAVFTESPLAFLTSARVAFAVWSAVGIAAVFALGYRLGAGPLLSATATFAFSFSSLGLYFAPRALSETACLPWLLMGLALAWPAGATRKQLLLGAIFIGLSCWLRLQVGIFAAGLVLVWLQRRQWPEAAWALASVAGVLLLAGLLDLATWGSPFHSFSTYLRFNLVEGRASDYGRAPPAFYTRALLRSLGPLWPLLGFASLCAVAAKPARALLATTAAFFAVHLLIPHKEVRFLLPLLPVMAVTGLLGLQTFAFTPLRRYATAAVVIAATVASAWSLPKLSFRELGIDYPRHPSALYRGDAENRLLGEAGRQGDLCGLWVLSMELEHLAGYAALHRNVPLYGLSTPPPKAAMANYRIQPLDPGATATATAGELGLYRTAPACEPSPRFEHRIR